MREKKNIFNYGFLVFLIVIGIVSIFSKNTSILNAVNSLSIPIFIFSIATILSKIGSFFDNSLFEKVISEEKRDEEYDKLVKRQEERIEKINSTSANFLEEKNFLNEVMESSIKCKAYLASLYKRKVQYSNLVYALNCIAMLSFTLCLLSLIGIIPFNFNCSWVNIFSLALVFFDFFVLDDLLKKREAKILSKLRQLAVEKVDKQLSED